MVCCLCEWGATVACLQQTMLERCKVRDWNVVEHGFLEGFVAVIVIERSRGVVIAGNEARFAKQTC